MLQIWLLLAVIVLAINLEVEAVPHAVDGGEQQHHSGDHYGHGYIHPPGNDDHDDHDGHDQGHGRRHGDDDDHDDHDGDDHDHDHDGDQSHAHKHKPSKGQKVILKKVLKYLQRPQLRATGEITVNGRRVPLDFIQTVVGLKGESLLGLTPDKLWGIIELYEFYERKLGTEPRNQNVSKCEEATLFYIATYLRIHPQVTGHIVVDGKTIPVLYIVYRLRQIGRNLRTVTTEQIREIADSYNSPVRRTPLGPRPTPAEIDTLNTIRSFLQTQGNTVTGSFTFAGHKISIQFIESYLELHGLNMKNATTEELWTAIRANIRETEQLNALPARQKVILRNILDYLRFVGDNATGEITFLGHQIPIDFILSVLHLRGADIRTLTAEDLWAIIQQYEAYEKKLGTEPEIRNVSKSQEVTLNYLATYLRSHPQETGEIAFDGVQIPLDYILNQLRTRGIDVRTLTAEQLYDIILSYISTYSPPEPAPLGSRPTAQQIFELNLIIGFLKTQGANATGNVTLGGYSIPIQFILRYLQQHGQSISNLTYGELWDIIRLYASNENGSTGTGTEGTPSGPTGTDGQGGTGSDVTPSGPSGTDGQGGTGGSSLNETLYSILEELLSGGLNATGYIDFEGRNISLQFLLTALSLKHINISNATPADIYNILLSYEHYADNCTTHVPGVPQGDIATLLAILQSLKTGEGGNGNVTFNGVEIPIQFVVDTAKALNVSINNLTTSELYYILQMYKAFENGSTTVIGKPPANVTAILDDILQALKTQGDNATGAVNINGITISLESIENILKELGLNPQNINTDQLWLILQTVLQSLQSQQQQQPGNSEGGSEGLLQFIIDTLSKGLSAVNSVVVDGISISVGEILNALGLHINNSTGKYDTEHLTAADVLRAVQQILSQHRASSGSGSVTVSDSGSGSGSVTSQTANNKEQLLQIFLQVIANPDNVAHSVLVFNGQNINVQDVVNALSLHIDSATGKYDTNSLTADQLYETIQQLVSTTTNATT
jgi:uncharacterized protein (DUF433 family)